MKKNVNILVALLVIQAGLAVYMLNKEEATATFQGKDPLLSFEKDHLDKIVIEEKDDDKIKSLQLVKKDGTWIIPSRFDFPASEAKILDFKNKMLGFKKSWPAGKTEISAKQFKVVDDSFERRVAFFQGEKQVNTLYLGSSPSFKKVHARVDDAKLTYSLNYTPSDLPISYKNWLNKKYLKLERTQVKEVSWGELSFENQGGDFLVQGLGDKEETDKAKSSSTVANLLGIDFVDVLGKKENVELGKQKWSFSMKLTDGKSITYNIYEEKDAKTERMVKNARGTEERVDFDWILVTSKHPYAFHVKESKFIDLLSLTKDDFVRPKAEEKKEGEGEDSGKNASLETETKQSSNSINDEKSENLAEED